MMSDELALARAVRSALRAMLRQTGATRADLARASGLSASHISDLLNGRRALTLRNITGMAQAMGWEFDVDFVPRMEG